MEEYIHLQNLILFKKRLAEPHSESGAGGAFEVAGG
jgi:hypothetical protein